LIGNDTKISYIYIYIYIINVVFLLYEEATVVAILEEAYYKRWICGDITNVSKPMHRVKYEGLNINGLKYSRTALIRIVLAVRVKNFSF
jgi:hypothetical protein